MSCTIYDSKSYQSCRSKYFEIWRVFIHIFEHEPNIIILFFQILRNFCQFIFLIVTIILFYSFIYFLSLVNVFYWLSMIN